MQTELTVSEYKILISKLIIHRNTQHVQQINKLNAVIDLAHLEASAAMGTHAEVLADEHKDEYNRVMDVWKKENTIRGRWKANKRFSILTRIKSSFEDIPKPHVPQLKYFEVGLKMQLDIDTYYDGLKHSLSSNDSKPEWFAIHNTKQKEHYRHDLVSLKEIIGRELVLRAKMHMARRMEDDQYVVLEENDIEFIYGDVANGDLSEMVKLDVE